MIGCTGTVPCEDMFQNELKSNRKENLSRTQDKTKEDKIMIGCI